MKYRDLKYVITLIFTIIRSLNYRLQTYFIKKICLQRNIKLKQKNASLRC